MHTSTYMGMEIYVNQSSGFPFRFYIILGMYLWLGIPIFDLTPTSLATFALLESDHDFDPKCIRHTAHSVGLNFHKCQFPSEKILPLD